MPRRIDYTVTEEYDGRKSIHFLRGHCGISSRLMRTVKFAKDGMLCNGEHIRTIDKVKCGDIITINIPDDEPQIELQNTELDILYEDDDVLVINKSPFMAMHPTHNHQGDTLANSVAGYLSKKGKYAAFRAVGRLDKGTSGVVVCALNKFSAAKLAGEIKKEYVALVKGELDGNGTVDVPIYRPDPMKTLRACSYDLGVEEAVTHWRVEKKFNGATLIRLNLETGRTHQIRVHMSYSGHPLAGDDMYGDFMTDIGHQLLHCRKCLFIHPVTNEKMELEAPLFDDFKNAVSFFEAE